MSIHGVPTTMAHRVVVTTIFDRSAFHSSTTRSAASRAAHSVSRATSSAAHLRDMSATTRACDHRRAYVGDDRPFEIRRSVKARCRLDRGGHVSRPQESAENWSPRSNSARVAASKPLRTGQGRTIGVVTVAQLFICFARVSLRVHLRAIAAKSQVSETPAAFRRP